MWSLLAPDLFSWSANPWYYITGLVCLLLAIRGALIYEKLPEKPDIMSESGKKVILK